MVHERVATGGSVFAAIATALALAIVVQGVPAPPVVAAIGLGSVALGGFIGRRFGYLSRWLAGIVGVVAGGMLAVGGVYVLATASVDGAVGGLAGALASAGVVCLAIGAAELRGTSTFRLARIVQTVSVAVLLVMVAFLAATLLRWLPIVAGVELSAVQQFGFDRVALAVGMLGVTIGFLVGTGRGLGYLDLGVPGRDDLGWTFGGIILVLGVAFVLGLLYSTAGVEGAEHEVARRGRIDGAELLLLAMPLTVIATAVAEEVLYRNGVQKFLTERFSTRWAIGLTSVVFAIAHVPALQATAVIGIVATIAVVFVLSLILGWVYHRTGNVLVPIAIHGTYNVIVFAIWYVQFS